MIKRSVLMFMLLASVAVIPARADDVSNRMDALEGQVRQLVGQIEELNYTVKQLQSQIAAGAPAATQPGALPMKKKLTLQVPVQPQVTGQASTDGVETIQEAPLQQDATQKPPQDGTLYGSADQPADGAAPAPKLLGSMDNKAANDGDGGFQGQVLVAPGGEQAATSAPADGVEQASLQPETADDLFLRSEQALLHLQYSDAESGFREFLSKYPDHNLAGSAQFKIGETYYARQQYAEAAQNYMSVYKQYHNSRRAPDSLMKLGLALNKLGQKEQGCAALSSVGGEYPNAVEVKKRSQSEFKRAAC
jgi:tol-pal system protein YbgF